MLGFTKPINLGFIYDFLKEFQKFNHQDSKRSKKYKRLLSFYLTFMRARRSATEVSFSILGSLVPNVQLDKGYVFTTADPAPTISPSFSLFITQLLLSLYCQKLLALVFLYELKLRFPLCRSFSRQTKKERAEGGEQQYEIIECDLKLTKINFGVCQYNSLLISANGL